MSPRMRGHLRSLRNDQNLSILSSLSTPPSATSTTLSATLLQNSSSSAAGTQNQSTQPLTPHLEEVSTWLKPSQNSQSSMTTLTSSISQQSFMNTSVSLTGEVICNLEDQFSNIERLLHQLAGNVTVQQSVMTQHLHQSSPVISSSASVISHISFRELSVYNDTEDSWYWLLNMKEDFKCESDHFSQDKNKVMYVTRNLKEDSVIKWRWQLMKLCGIHSVIINWGLFRTWLQDFYNFMNPAVSAENAMIQLTHWTGQMMCEFVLNLKHYWMTLHETMKQLQLPLDQSYLQEYLAVLSPAISWNSQTSTPPIKKLHYRLSSI